MLLAGVPIIMSVQNKDGGLRLCIDYQEVKQITIKNCYSLPFIKELIDKLKDAQYFTKLNL